MKLGLEGETLEVEGKSPEEEEVLVPEVPTRLVNIIFLCITYAIGFFVFGYNLGAFNPIQENLNFDLK